MNINRHSKSSTLIKHLQSIDHCKGFYIYISLKCSNHLLHYYKKHSLNQFATLNPSNRHIPSSPPKINHHNPLSTSSHS